MIQRIEGSDAIIEFSSFENEDSTPLIEPCPLSCIRPRPARVIIERGSLRCGIEVDVLKDDVWWEGVIVGVHREGVDVRLHTDGSVQKGLGLDDVRGGLVFDILWYERSNITNIAKKTSLPEEQDGVITVQCSRTQFDIEGAGTACTIISALNGLSVLLEPERLVEWNEDWLRRTMESNMDAGALEFVRLGGEHPTLFTSSGYTSIRKICSREDRGGLLSAVEHVEVCSRSGFMKEKPRNFSSNAHNLAVTFCQVRESFVIYI